MRELERDHPHTTSARGLAGRLAILGAGRAGGSIGRAAAQAGLETTVGRAEADLPRADVVLICVPDKAIGSVCDEVASALRPGTLVGHVSGATPLAALEGARARGCETFSLHPLQTIPTPQTDLSGAPCAIAAATRVGLEAARELAERLGMRPFEVPEESRAAYHAAAAMASNFLIALEESATALLESAGVGDARDVLAPLVLRTAANWADAGADSLTGPIARGDEETVALHRAALAENAPDLLALYDSLAERTRALGEQA
jgi:predicted short-subunit dehydrogenase-like oxidoreductase (DUF2520 family)